MDKLRKQKRDIFAVIDEAFIDADGRLLSSLQDEFYEEEINEPATEPLSEEIVEAPNEVVEETVEEETAISEAAAEVVEDEPVEETVEEPVEEVVEEPVEETVEEAVEEPVEDTVEEAVEDTADQGALTLADVEAVQKEKVISKTFAQKMLEASDVLQDRYDELLNYAARFKKVKARISRKFDSINQGRLQFVKLSVAGKTLKLYLNMDINTVDPKFHCKDMSDKKTYVTVPVLLRVKSGRAVKYAKRLIDQCAQFHGLNENKKYQEVDAIARIEAFQQAKEDKNNDDNDNE